MGKFKNILGRSFSSSLARGVNFEDFRGPSAGLRCNHGRPSGDIKLNESFVKSSLSRIFSFELDSPENGGEK